MKIFILLTFATTLSLNVLAQKKADITFSVSAVCGMCEERIEEAFDVKGIVMANYDLTTKKLHVVYKTKHFPSELDVHKIAAAAGHDTQKIKATDEAYANLHSCCKYRDGSKNCTDN